MNTKQRPPFLRRRLGHRLRALREAAGLTIEDAAAKLDKTRSALHRIEAGQTRADVHLIRSMMDVYDIYVDDLVETARKARKPRWFTRFRSAYLGYVDVETEAVQVRQFCVLTLPGLLQIEPYMRSLFDRKLLRRTPKGLQEQVDVRLIRQRRLNSEDDPLELVAIVDEAALRRRVGGAGVMRSQLEHLIHAAALPTVTFQVVPLLGGAHGAMEGGFNLLSFPEEDEPDMLYVEYVTGSLHIEDAEEVDTAKLAFEQLRTEALGPADSVGLIERVRAELDDA